MEGARALVNLSGSNIARKWDERVVQGLFDSRLGPTRLLGQVLERLETPPAVWINASGIGYYGDRGDEALDEASSAGQDTVAELARRWEEAQDEATLPRTRRVKLRIGLVLGRSGGAYPKLAMLTRLFLGGHVGSGRQWTSWIHVRDLTRMFEFAIESDVSGPLNAVSPEPVTNRDFMAAMRRAHRRPWSPPLPAFMLRLANLFGAPEPSLLLTGQRASPRGALEAGFKFELPHLEQALEDLKETRP